MNPLGELDHADGVVIPADLKNLGNGNWLIPQELDSIEAACCLFSAKIRTTQSGSACLDVRKGVKLHQLIIPDELGELDDWELAGCTGLCTCNY